MKIVDHHWGNWEVSLVDENSLALAEYKHASFPAEDGKPAQATFYVECKNDQQFAIITRRPVNTPSSGCRIALAVDGREVSKRAFLVTAKTHVLDWVPELIDDVVHQRKLVFRPLKRSEEGTNPGDTGMKLGTIEVTLKGGIYYSLDPQLPQVLSAAQGGGAVPEKFKKATLTSYVGGDGGVVSAQLAHYRFNPNDGPEYKIIINYATRPALEILGVIPASIESRYINMQPAGAGPSSNTNNGRRSERAEEDADDDNDVVSIAAPTKRRKIEVIDLVSDSEDEEQNKTDKNRISELTAELEWVRKQLDERNRVDLKVKQERLEKEVHNAAAGPSKT